MLRAKNRKMARSVNSFQQIPEEKKMRHKTGPGKVDYSFENFWSSVLAPWERNLFSPAGTLGIIRFYNFDIDSAEIKPGHQTGFDWLGEMALKNAVMETNDEILVIGAHSNTGNRKYNFQLARARAISVGQFLITRGIPFGRMSVFGSQTLDQDSRGEQERWRAVSVIFKAFDRRTLGNLPG
jgi:outer membrane protein OmpA-like peptidoglycan-associated protein